MRSTLPWFLSAIALTVLLARCARQEKPASLPLERYTYHQAMMGTRFQITLYAQSKTMADEAAMAAFRYADQVNTACSDYDVTSELMQLNDSPANKTIPVSPLLYDVLAKARDVAAATNGAYDPTLGHHSYNWRMARRKMQLPTAGKINQAKASSGWQKYQLDPTNQAVTKTISNMRFDLGGIAKGYAADGMLRILMAHHISQASITAGGEVRLGDPPPGRDGWEVTLSTLDANHRLSPHTLTLSNCAISTSGDLHQSITINGQRYSHIVDPATGLGLTTRRSATVIGETCTQTDALATALCVNPGLKPAGFMTLVIFEKPDGHPGVLLSERSENWPHAAGR
ncbi:MAG: FAD:protein FMN transferase [Akkermansiaceae bacterium]|nr:FAD:protein FMN transferase [Akkermansiaceae bacterium]